MGLDFQSMSSTQLYPAVLRTEIDYRVAAVLGDKLQIYGKLEQLERVRFWCSFVMTRESDDKVLVTCRQSLAMVQMGNGKPARPTRLPGEWTSQWGHLLG